MYVELSKQEIQLLVQCMYLASSTTVRTTEKMPEPKDQEMFLKLYNRLSELPAKFIV